MHLTLITLDYEINGCDSLKEKAACLNRLRDRIGKKPEIAVAEADFFDDPRRARWIATVLCADGIQHQKWVQFVEQEAARIDATLIGVEREAL